MSDNLSFNYSLSDRLSHSDCSVQLERDRMMFSRLGNSAPAVCAWQEGMDPIWTWGDRALNLLGNSVDPVHDMLRNVGIYPPIVFQDLLVALWKSWRSREIDDNTAEAELKELFNWLEGVGKSRPRTDFWNGKF